MPKLIPPLSVTEINQIGHNYKPGFFNHNQAHDTIAQELKDYQEDSIQSYKERWDYLARTYRQLKSHSSRIAKDIRDLFKSKFDTDLKLSGKLVNCIADEIQNAINERLVLTADITPLTNHLSSLLKSPAYPVNRDDYTLNPPSLLTLLSATENNLVNLLSAVADKSQQHPLLSLDSVIQPNLPVIWQRPRKTSCFKKTENYCIGTLMLLGFAIAEKLKLTASIKEHQSLLTSLGRTFINSFSGRPVMSALTEGEKMFLALSIERLKNANTTKLDTYYKVKPNEVIKLITNIMTKNQQLPFAILISVTTKIAVMAEQERACKQSVDEALSYFSDWELGKSPEEIIEQTVGRLNSADDALSEKMRRNTSPTVSI
jgi:hypothetical protein